MDVVPLSFAMRLHTLHLRGAIDVLAFISVPCQEFNIKKPIDA
jgi:hypothetical protein